MAMWWRVREVGGRFYPEFTEDNGQTWKRTYEVAAIKNGYKAEWAARKYAEVSIANGAGWWESPDTLTKDEKNRLYSWILDHASGMNDDTEDEVGRRLRFHRWLVATGRLSEDVVREEAE